MDRKEDIRNFENFIGSMRNFKMFYDHGVRGFSDIDTIYEKHGNFVILEGKTVYGSILRIPYGQALLLKNLVDKLQEPSVCYLIGIKDVSYSTKHYYLVNMKDVFIKGKDTRDRKDQRVLEFKLENTEGPMNEQVFCEKIKKQCDYLENLF